MTGAVRARRGFTLMEMLAAILVLALITAGIAVMLRSAMGTHSSARFESTSAALVSSLNTALCDLGRYGAVTADGSATDAVSRANGITADGFRISSDRWAVADAQFTLDGDGALQLSGGDGTAAALIAASAYGGCVLTDFTAVYDADAKTLTFSYTVAADDDSGLTRSGHCSCRVLNA